MKLPRSAKRRLCVWLPCGPHAGSDVRERDSVADRVALEKLAVWCEQFSPIVALDESDTVGTLLLDVTGLAHLFGGEGALARQVVRKFHRRGLTVRVAVADTIGAAWALSHFGFQVSDLKLLKLIPPIIVASGQTMTALGPLPVRSLRLPDDMLQVLGSLGIYTIDQLAVLPRDQLSARFGKQLLLRLDQATGARDEAVIAHRKPVEVTAEHLLEYPTYRREMIGQVLQQLVERICGQLAHCGQGAMQLVCRLEMQGTGPVQIAVGLYRPSAQPRYLMDLIDLQLERVKLCEMVTAIQVTATVTAALEIRQQELFDAGKGNGGRPGSVSLSLPEDERRQLAHLVDRLSSRLGRQAVAAPRLLRDAIPELACRLEPLTSRKKGRVGSKKTSPQRNVIRKRYLAGDSSDCPQENGTTPFLKGDVSRVFHRVPRPLFLEPSPRRIRVVAMVPDGQPIRFQWNATSYVVAQAWGPERIETGWWRGNAPAQVRRDYYQVETTTGQRFWLFRCRNNGKWFLHGEFD